MPETGNKRRESRVQSGAGPMTNSATEIQVVRRNRAGWHIYTCEALPGLYVASKDDRAAYNDVPVAIKMLFKLDYGADVSVHNKVDYSTFMARIEMGRRAETAMKERTREMMDSHQSVLSYLIGSSDNDFATGSH